VEREPYAYFQNEFVPISQAKVSIMTHAFNYGTGCFEGIRGNWNAETEQLYVFRLREHYERLIRSAKLLRMTLPNTAQQLCEITRELVERNGYREDMYVRPIAYKGSLDLGPRVHKLEDHLAIFTIALGNYIDVDAGVRVGVSSWRRVDENAIPARGKVTGIYVNNALARTEAADAGFDEAIMLTSTGTVCEGSGENVFLVINGKLVTPAESESILVGITRHTVLQLARDELGLEIVERQVARNELYTADELFMVGTAAHVTPIVAVDHRAVADGAPGPVTKQLQSLYFDVIRGRVPKYMDWLTPVYPARVPAR
jgi:branched-chain amino acid aminotransferase